MEEKKSYSKNEIENSRIYTHRYMNYICGSLFLIWCFFDFYQREIYAPLFFLGRLFLFTLMIVFVSPLNDKFFKKNHLKFTAIYLTLLNIFASVFTLLATTSFQASLTYVIMMGVASALLYQGNSKLYFPIAASPLITSLIIYGLSDTTMLNNEHLIIQALFFMGITLVAHINIFQFTEKSYRMRLKFEDQKGTLENLLSENNQLVRILCHDLGNAITIIEMSSYLMEKNIEKQDISNKVLDKSLDRIKRAVKTQKEIIEHVKQKEAIESGKEEIELVPVNLNIIFEKVRFIFQSQIENKNLNLNIIYSSDKTPHVIAELVSLSNHVINNIVSNAIKFSEDGSDITISTWSDKKHVYITIEDSGIGMSEELVKNVFCTKAKTSRPGVNGEKGTGFGMPLAKAYMLKYGGEIFVESKTGKGTRFTLKFNNIETHQNTQKLAA